MKKALTAAYLLFALTVLLCPPGIAQQNQTETKSNSIDGLTAVLKQLDDTLKEGVAFEHNQWSGLRRTYVRLKQREGCNVTFQVSEVPSRAIVAGSNRPVGELSIEEWRVNLSDLAVDQVKIEASLTSEYRFLQFTTSDNKDLIEWRRVPAVPPTRLSSASFKIDPKQAASAAATLSQAIRMCTKQ